MNFLNGLLSSAIKSWGGIVSLGGLFCGVIVFFVAPDKAQVPLNWVLLILSLLIVLLIISLRAGYEASQGVEFKPPKVLTVIDPPSLYSHGSALMLLESASFLSYDSVVSLYYLENEIEKFVSIGKVLNIQNDKKVQVLLADLPDSLDRIKKLKDNRSDDLKSLIVKPSIPSTYIDIQL